MKLLKISFFTITLALAQPMFADVSLTLGAGNLRTSDGSSLMPGTGLIVLLADSNQDGFASIGTDNFASGDDTILFQGALDSGLGDGMFLRSVNLTLAGGLTAGDPVQLYWYPTLSESSTSPGHGTSFGSYRDATGSLDGSDPWILPSDGMSMNLNFLTASAGGSNPDSIGWASQVTPMPEPQSLLLAGLGGALLLFVGRLRKQY